MTRFWSAIVEIQCNSTVYPSYHPANNIQALKEKGDAGSAVCSKRQHMLSELYAITCPSVRHMGRSVENGWSLDHAIFTIQLLHPSPVCAISFIQKFWRDHPRAGASNKGRLGETRFFVVLTLSLGGYTSKTFRALGQRPLTTGNKIIVNLPSWRSVGKNCKCEIVVLIALNFWNWVLGLDIIQTDRCQFTLCISIWLMNRSLDLKLKPIRQRPRNKSHNIYMSWIEIAQGTN